jgi:hypothetical protein
MAYVSDVLSLDVPCEVNAPRIVRQALAAVHDGGWSLDDGLLVASELVTVAVKHSGCVAAQSLTVQVGIARGNVVISVHVPGLPAGSADAAGLDRYGRGRLGLQIVDSLSVRWGTEPRDGYGVWAELPARGRRRK